MERASEDEIRSRNAKRTGGGRPEAETPPLILVGVQHTGTTFFDQLLRPLYGWKTDLRTEGGRYYYDHPWPAKMDFILDRAMDHILVTTVRDKMATARSWQRRGIHEPTDFHDQWQNWEEIIYPRADFVVSVDDRSGLDELSQALGVTLETDWKPVNAST